MKVVAVYMRVSTSDQTIRPQLHEVETWLKAKEAPLVSYYVDEAISGSSTQRPELKRLLLDVKAGLISSLVVVKLDRLFRSLSDLLATIKLLESYEVTFVSIKDNVDLGTAAGRFMLQILGAVAEFERSLVSDRTKAGIVVARAAGKQIGALNKPIDEPLLFRLHNSGMSTRAIAKSMGIHRSLVQRRLARKPPTP